MLGNLLINMKEESGNPSLITSMTGGNFAVTGNANVSFGVDNGGK